MGEIDVDNGVGLQGLFRYIAIRFMKGMPAKPADPAERRGRRRRP
jgi:hypothetical protein